jgi:serine/threonine protein kinase
MPPSLRPGDILVGKYRIERMLGRGGMGEVHLAENTAIGRKVAIKVLRIDEDDDEGPDDELLARFRGEARTAAAIGHPGIVDVLDMGATDDGTEFIVMEFLDGESLRERLDRVGRLGVAEISRIGGDMLEALAAAHDAGVVHRDIKPENVFLVARPVVETKILDFGISKLTRAPDMNLTSTGRIMGTPHYMSPEQGRGDRVDSATDVYSAGAVLYRALSGVLPVPGDSINEVITNLATRPPLPLSQQCPELPRPLAGVVDKMLARLPEARPTARAAAAALRATAAGYGGLADGIAETAPRAGDVPRPGLESTLGATASELGLAPTDPSAASQGSRSRRIIVLALAAVAVAATTFALVRPWSSHSSSTLIDAPSPAIIVDAIPMDAALPLDASVDATHDATPLDAPPRRRPSNRDAGTTEPNLDDVKDQSPFQRGTRSGVPTP